MPAEEKPENLATAAYWQDEIAASEKELEKFRKQGKRVIEKFLDKQSNDDFLQTQSLNLFHSNVVTLRSMLYGQTPKVDVSRRYEDSADDVARVASEILERTLNNDIQFTDDTFSEAIRGSLDDFLLPGLGQAKIRYEPQFGMDPMGNESIVSETAPVDYIHWQDFLWSAGARTWAEVRWVAFRTYVTNDEATQKWGEEVAARLSYSSKKERDDRDRTTTAGAAQYAPIWEIWCKKSRHVYWWSIGLDELAGSQPDPLQLYHFFPCPQPMLANITTGCMVPKAEYTFAQDLYNQIDALTTRIAMLGKAIKVVGVYDKSSVGVQRMLNEAAENELIPVDNWAAFAEKGGIQGQVDWLPIEQISQVMGELTQLRDQTIQLLYQTTGMSDIMRGSTDPRETKGAQELKSKFASTRVQALQDMFAKFATDLQKLKAEIMIRHYQPQTLIQQSNIVHTPDAQLAGQAVQLLKNPETGIWRIQIRPESIAMVDYAQLKNERMEYIMGLSQFMQSAAPLAQLDKSVTPTLMELLKWGLSGFKGSQQIEGVLDKAIADASKQLQQPPQPPPPDPKVEAMKMQAQMKQQEAQQKAQQDQIAFQQEMAQQQQKFALEMQQMKQEFELKMQQMLMELGIKKEEAQLKQRTEVVNAVMNVRQQAAVTDIQKKAKEDEMEMEDEEEPGEPPEDSPEDEAEDRREGEMD